MQPLQHEIHKNNSHIFFQLATTLLWLITLLLVQKDDRRRQQRQIQQIPLIYPALETPDETAPVWSTLMAILKCMCATTSLQTDLQLKHTHLWHRYLHQV